MHCIATQATQQASYSSVRAWHRSPCFTHGCLHTDTKCITIVDTRQYNCTTHCMVYRILNKTQAQFRPLKILRPNGPFIIGMRMTFTLKHTGIHSLFLTTSHSKEIYPRPVVDKKYILETSTFAAPRRPSRHQIKAAAREVCLYGKNFAYWTAQYEH